MHFPFYVTPVYQEMEKSLCLSNDLAFYKKKFEKKIIWFFSEFWTNFLACSIMRNALKSEER